MPISCPETCNSIIRPRRTKTSFTSFASTGLCGIRLRTRQHQVALSQLLHRPLTAAQTKAVSVLFQNHFDQVVIEYQGDARSFADGAAALSHVKTLTA